MAIEHRMTETDSDRRVQQACPSSVHGDRPDAKDGLNAARQDGSDSGDKTPADLNNPSPEPPEASKQKLRENARESAKLDSPQRTNDSTIDPNKAKEDILKGFHGG